MKNSLPKNYTIINGGNNRYLSELPEFANGLPHGVVNKTLPDVGGTFVAINCPDNYIVVCPYKDLIESICADTNNRYPVIPLHGDISREEFVLHYNANAIKKIAVTYDSFHKLSK